MQAEKHCTRMSERNISEDLLKLRWNLQRHDLNPLLQHSVVRQRLITTQRKLLKLHWIRPHRPRRFEIRNTLWASVLILWLANEHHAAPQTTSTQTSHIDVDNACERYCNTCLFFTLPCHRSTQTLARVNLTPGCPEPQTGKLLHQKHVAIPPAAEDNSKDPRRRLLCYLATCARAMLIAQMNRKRHARHCTHFLTTRTLHSPVRLIHVEKRAVFPQVIFGQALPVAKRTYQSAPPTHA
mmetsp:Transcript_11932/g.26357  ORF Transcript_11932/g.26357 Transcript_11932/m.26357 type:complete len:239 (-) Transcript_11932:408-1124(-)